nr:hypothetical protein [Tanacetum cinerariifolium]
LSKTAFAKEVAIKITGPEATKGPIGMPPITCPSTPPMNIDSPPAFAGAGGGSIVPKRTNEPEEEEEEDNGASGKVQPTASQSSSVTSGGGVGGVAVFNTTNGDGGSDYPFSGDVMGWGSSSRTPY